MNFTTRLFQHRGIWHVEVNGKRRSLQTRDKAEAKLEYAKIRKQWLAGKLSQLTKECQKTLKEYRDEFVQWAEQVQPRSTFRANRLALDKLMHFAGERMALDRISLKHLDQMIADSRKKGLSTASINVYIRHARSALNKAKEWGYVQQHPLAGAKELPAQRRPPAFLDRAAASRFIASIKDVDLRRLVVAYLATGRRRSELASLEWKD
jgi:integrase